MFTIRRTASVTGRTQSEMTSIGNIKRGQVPGRAGQVRDVAEAVGHQAVGVEQHEHHQRTPEGDVQVAGRDRHAGISAITLAKNTNMAAVPISGKYFLARSASITLLARS